MGTAYLPPLTTFAITHSRPWVRQYIRSFLARDPRLKVMNFFLGWMMSIGRVMSLLVPFLVISPH